MIALGGKPQSQVIPADRRTCKMSIGIALVLIFVLYLIDKHNLWRLTFKLAVGLIVLAIVGIGGFFGWQKYQAYREERQERAAAAAKQAEIAACVSRLQTSIDSSGQFVEDLSDPTGRSIITRSEAIQNACAIDPQATAHDWLVPLVTITPDSTAAAAKPKATPKKPIDFSSIGGVPDNHYGLVPAAPVVQFDPSAAYSPAPPSSPKDCEAGCSGWAVVRPQLDSIRTRDCFNAEYSFVCHDIAHLRQDDRLQIVSDKTRMPDARDAYEVKFQEWTGWVNAADLSPEKGEEK
jgi:hypothetical protein